MRWMRASWTGTKLGFEVGNDRLPFVRVDVDEPEPLGDDEGYMPTELLLGALGGCVGMNATALLRKRKLPLAALSVLVEGTQSEDWPKQYTSIDLTFELTWSDAPDDALVDLMLDKAVHSYCPVGGTISSDVALAIRRKDVVRRG